MGSKLHTRSNQVSVKRRTMLQLSHQPIGNRPFQNNSRSSTGLCDSSDANLIEFSTLTKQTEALLRIERPTADLLHKDASRKQVLELDLFMGHNNISL